MFKSQAAGECIKNILGAFVALISEKEEKKNGEKEKKKKKLKEKDLKKFSPDPSIFADTSLSFSSGNDIPE